MNMTVHNFEYYNSHPLNQTSFFVLLTDKFANIDPLPESLVSIVAKAARSFVDQVTYLNNFAPLVKQPNYDFIAKCYSAFPRLFGDGFEDVEDLKSQIRCIFLYLHKDEGIENPIADYKAFQASRKLYNAWRNTQSDSDCGWYLYPVLLTNDVIDREYFDLLTKETSVNCEELESIMDMSREERWSYYIVTGENDDFRKLDSIVVNYFLSVRCRKELLFFARKYGSAKVQLKFCQLSTNSLSIVPRDFINCPSHDASSNATFNQSNITVTHMELCDVLAPDLLYKVFLLVVEADFVYALTIFRLVCKSWNEASLMNDVRIVKDVVLASSSAAIFFVNDLLVQLVRKASSLNIFPWPCLEFKEACEIVLVLSEVYKDIFSTDQILKHQLRCRSDEDIGDCSSLKNYFNSALKLLYREVVGKVRFQSYNHLDRFVRLVLANVDSYDSHVPFTMNEEILWPSPEALLCKDNDKIL
jgi:hypothetical protein